MNFGITDLPTCWSNCDIPLVKTQILYVNEIIRVQFLKKLENIYNVADIRINQRTAFLFKKKIVTFFKFISKYLIIFNNI